MSSSLLEAAFAHHVWATSRVIDACLDSQRRRAGDQRPRHAGADARNASPRRPQRRGRAVLPDGQRRIRHRRRTRVARRGSRHHGAQRFRMGRVHLPSRSTPTRWCSRSTRPTGINGGLPSGSGSRRHCTTAPTIAVRSAQRSRRSVWSRRRSMSITSGSTRDGSWRRCPTRSAPRRSDAAEADGNRTRQGARRPLYGFEDRGAHQEPRRLRLRAYRVPDQEMFSFGSVGLPGWPFSRA